MKRLFDILVASLVLGVIWPLLLACGIAVRLDSPGSVFYTQERVGRGGHLFRIYKFRSMVKDADRIGSYQTAEGDPRITHVGRFLRRTSLDELPQLINVLTGDMSLVGPRPDVPAQRETYSDDDWAKRTSVRPGLTGLAQATLRSSATRRERLALDLEYVARSSVLFDLKVILLTFKQALSKGGF